MKKIWVVLWILLLWVFLLFYYTSSTNLGDEIDVEKVDTGGQADITESTSKVSTEAVLSLEFIREHYADNLVGDVEIVDCILSGGTESECYKFTVAPEADHEIGP